MQRILIGLMSVAMAGPAAAQFAAQRPGTQPTSIIPAMPATAPPASAHPWYVKPEAGAWMICVKSYSGENAKLFAENLAQEIREKYRVPAYLFERGSAERQAERDRYNKELERRRSEMAKERAEFNAVLEKARIDAAAKGMEVLESKARTIAPTVTIEDQYAVLIGGWADMATARKELDKVRKWEPPGNKQLMDTQYIMRGKNEGELAYINPFQSGMVVPNPVASRPADPEGEADTRLVMKLNADEKYSVLKIQKPWTIVVKNFAPPQQIKDKEEKSLIAQFFSPKKNVMVAAGEQAVAFCEALRGMKLEAYVLHTKYGSMVCVGQYDAADDPKLMAMQQQLGNMKFYVGQDAKNEQVVAANNKRMFDRLYAMRVR